MPTEPRRKQLGELLIRRRIELDPRYENRRTFEAERWPERYRQISKLETGWAGNYEPATLIAAEIAYDLEPGTISRFLDGGELEPRRAPVTESTPPALRVASDTAAAPPAYPRRIPRLSPEMEAATAKLLADIKRLVQRARLKDPTGTLAGAQIFSWTPGAPGWYIDAAWYWDRMLSSGWSPEDLPAVVAMQITQDQQEAAAGQEAPVRPQAR